MNIEQKAKDYLNWFNVIWSKDVAIHIEDITPYISSNLKLFINGKLIAHNNVTYVTLLTKLRSRVRDLKIHMPLHDVVSSKNKVAMSYRETLTYYDSQVDKMAYTAFMHFNADGKINSISFVFNKFDF